MGEPAESNRVATDHLVVFVNAHSPHSLALADALVRLARGTLGFGVAAVVETSRRRPRSRPTLALRQLGATAARRLFQADAGTILPRGALDSAQALARRAGVRLIEPPERDLNHSGFVAELRMLAQPLVAVSLECLQIFGADLLGSFDLAVNYHNGRLPDYRGLGATSWSVYHGEAESGFSFHRMEGAIDTGPILLDGSVPIGQLATTFEVESAKTRAAIEALPEVLDAIRGRRQGRRQEEPGRYFSRRHLQQVRRVEDPSTLTRSELERRLRAFGVLEMTLGGATYPVTALAEASGPRTGAFVSSDGAVLKVSRILHLPPRLYGVVAPIYRRLRR